MVHPSPARALLDELDETFKFTDSFRIPTPVSGDHNVVVRCLCRSHCRRSVPLCFFGTEQSGTLCLHSSWLGIGWSVRISMMLMSLKSAQQSPSVPNQAASF